MSRPLTFLVPLLILGLGVAGFVVMKSSKPKPKPRPIEIRVPTVRTIDVQPQPYTFVVESEGTIRPRAEVRLVAEVGGRVVRMNSHFETGGALEAGSEILAIDPRDYELEVTRARAEVTRARLALEVERANSDVARNEWERLGSGEGNPLVLREPQVNEAEATVASARAVLEQAERNRDRAVVSMPWNGRVRQRLVDEGQVVSPGQQLGTVYATDYVEVRVPLSGDDIGFLGVSLDHGARANGVAPPPVTLTSQLGGNQHRWSGTLARTEGEIDPATRLTYAVVRVDDPYSRSMHPDASMPLAVGLFVETAIVGREIDACFVIPRAALRGASRVFVIDEDNRLRIREVSVIRAESDRVVVGDGLSAGDRVVLSPMDAPVDGMRVRSSDEASAAGGDAS